MKAIIDGLIVLPNEIINGHVIMYEKDIWRIVPRKQFRAGMCSEFIDANGGFVVPGFINEHIHGCAGADTMDDDDQGRALGPFLRDEPLAELPWMLAVGLGEAAHR